MNTRRGIGLVLLALVLAVPAAPAVLAHGDEKHDEKHEEGQKLTVQGEVVDLACWVAHGAKGAEHVKCAQACAKGGQPIGLLTADGTVYLLYASHEDGSAFAQAKEQAGKNVEITGLASTKGGIRGLEVNAVKAL